MRWKFSHLSSLILLFDQDVGKIGVAIEAGTVTPVARRLRTPTCWPDPMHRHSPSSALVIRRAMNAPHPRVSEGLTPSWWLRDDKACGRPRRMRARLECCFDLLLRRAMLALTQHDRLGHGVSESTALINLNV